jgi:hypothetical protein
MRKPEQFVLKNLGETYEGLKSHQADMDDLGLDISERCFCINSKHNLHCAAQGFLSEEDKSLLM